VTEHETNELINELQTFAMNLSIFKYINNNVTLFCFIIIILRILACVGVSPTAYDFQLTLLPSKKRLNYS